MKNKINVVMLSTSSSRNAGGLYNCVICLGKSLYESAEIDVSVLAFPDQHSKDDEGNYEPLKLVNYDIIGPPGIGFTFNLKSKLVGINPEINHLHGIWLYTSYVNTKYSAAKKIPYIISIHGMLDPWILSQRTWKKKLGLFLYENRNIQNATCLHALNLIEYNCIRKLGFKNPVAIIPNGVEIPNIPEKEIDTPIWKSDDSRKVILFISRLHPKKGIENLLNAWSHIGEYSKDWKLIIAGESMDPSYYEKLIELKKDLSLSNDVFFIGSQFHEEKDACFRFSDGFILPSFSEGMPIAVLEAWAYGLPTLITEACNLPEGFASNAAIRIEPNIESILLGLKSYFSMPEKQRKEMGNKGTNLVKDRFTWNMVANQMKSVYLWALKKAEAPPFIRFD